MPKKWVPEEIPSAFNEALEKAVADTSGKLTAELLDKTKAKNALAREGDITVPNEVEIVFYREEDLPFRVVMAIPAKEGGQEIEIPKEPTFADCFLCTYDTYIHGAESANLLEIFRGHGLLAKTQ
jgi:hypothetical protein